MSLTRRRFQAKAVEIVFDGHIDGQALLAHYRATFGLYCGFVKWHTNDGNHTHVALVLLKKPCIDMHRVKTFFGFEGILPKLHEPLGRGNTAPKKKMARYVAYLTDGHDNGQFYQTWNWKYDFELMSCSNIVSKCLLRYTRGESINSQYGCASWDDRVDMCAKQKDILRAIRHYRRIMVKPPRPDLLPWQKCCEHDLGSQDSRNIMWVCGLNGNEGKTVLARYLRDFHDAAYFCGGSAKDIACAYRDQKIIVFNFTNNVQEIPYDVIEQLKDGAVFSGKYGSETIFNERPKILVVANCFPDTSRLKNSRFDVRSIEKGKLIKLEEVPVQELFIRDTINSPQEALTTLSFTDFPEFRQRRPQNALPKKIQRKASPSYPSVQTSSPRKKLRKEAPA